MPPPPQLHQCRHTLTSLCQTSGGLQVGMQINPQVNTNIIRSVTLQHCPRGMCEFHLEISLTSDNGDNREPSDFQSPINLAKNAHYQMKTGPKTNPNRKSKAEPNKLQEPQ